jgi:putative ABC transport system permease protein
MNHRIYQLKQAWAGLSAKRGFLVTVVTTLGSTLGALLCILTLAYVVIAKPLPYPDQQHLYQLNAFTVDEKGEQYATPDYTYPGLVHLFDNQTLFIQSALVHYGDGVLSSQPTKPSVNTTSVTPGWFTLLDSKIALGRTFEQTEAKDSYNPVAILSYETWQNEFNSDSTILEQTVTISGASFRVVGVLAEAFIEPQLSGIGVKTDIFLPWDYNSFNFDPERRVDWSLFSAKFRFFGKLDSPFSITQFEQTLTTLANDTWQENTTDILGFKGWSIKMELQSFKNAILGDSKNTVLLLLAGVIGLVLVACANITNLFMSRTAEQQRQLAIQAAVGASKSHLFQTLFAQSGLVVFISVLVALVIASGGFWVLQHYLALRLPRVDELAINSVTLGSALLIALLLGLFFARLSANMIKYRALNATLQSSGKGTGIQVSQKVRRWLVISQVTIVTLLVFVNMGLLRDSLKIIHQPLGFETENISSLTLRVNSASDLSEEERKPLMLELKNKLMALPQVEDVAQAVPPLNRGRTLIQVIEATEERLLVQSRSIDDRYFQMIGQPLIEGDFFSAADLKDENNLIIVNDVYATKLAAQGSALGAKITLGETTLYTVSGVVKGVKMPTETDIPMRAYLLTTEAESRFILKLKPQQTLSREMAATMLQEVSRQFSLLELEALDKQQDQLLFTQYTTAITSAVLAVLTFFLATIGLYGILNYATQMRRFELGIRIALGAKRIDVIGLIIKDNAGAVGIGIVISLIVLLALSIGFSEALASYINLQLITLFFVTLVSIGFMALFACYWPLRPIINSPAIRSLRGSQ